MATATLISSCSATTCAFNNNGCTALAITVAGDSERASCGTFAELDARSTRAGESVVGACHRLECVHNKDLTCSNESISIVGNTASCADYQVA